MRFALIAFVISGCGFSTLEMSGQQQPDPLTGTPSVVPVDAGQGGGGGGGIATGGGAATGGGGAATGGGSVEPIGGGANEPTGGGSPPPPPPICEDGAVGVCTTSCGSQGSRVCTEANWGPCRVPAESCDNGVDDDCDGRIDHADGDCTPIVHTCEMNDGNGCNGDWGYGDRCAPVDNEANCSAERFNAWCNRRNPATPDIWENYVQGWVTNRCDGALEETGGQYNTFFCRSSSNDEFRCTTPLVFSFDSGAVKFEQSDRPFAFTPGVRVQSDWPSAATPWLARDLNGNGRIDDGGELFGSNTRVRDGIAKHGFEALAALDGNGDGAIDARDSVFRELMVWRDANGDRRSQRSELTSLAEERIDSISLGFRDVPKCDARGNCERQRAAFGFRDTSGAQREGSVIDVWLKIATPAIATR